MTVTQINPAELPEMWMELRDPEFLRELIDEQGISVRELARFAGWKSHTYLMRLLRGEVKTVKVMPASRIAYRLGVPVHRLFVTRVSGDTGHASQRKRAAA